jgi:general secretion pathway protein D
MKSTRRSAVNTRRFLCLCLTLAGLLLPAAGGLGAEPQKPAVEKKAGGKVTLDFKEIELADLIQTVSELTGRNFIFDETVKGKVTIISPAQMSLEDAYQLFLTVLNVKGFTVVPSGKANKIVPIAAARESSLPIRPEGAAGEQYATRLIPLQNLDATTLAGTILPPLMPKTGSVVAYPPANTLIITDTAANIERLSEIIRELDVPGALDRLEIIPLQFAAAEEVAPIANQILAQGTAPRRGLAAGQPAGKEPSRIIAYPRTNALVVMTGAEDLATVRSLIERLDQKPARERSNINVYYLENADAETLAKTLNEILTGLRARTVRTPQPGQTAATEPVSIIADKPTNSLIINATPEDYETIRGIVRQLDIKRKQVFVEALILELSMDATKRLGASLQGAVEVGGDSLIFGTSNLNTATDNAGNPVGIGSLLPPSGSSVPSLLSQSINGILLGGLFNPITVTGPDGKQITIPALSALIDVAKTDTDVNILSAPRLLTSDNEEAEIVVGSNVPIITQRLTNAVGAATDTGTGLATSVAVERKDVALTLRFTPQVTEGDLVRLNVYQEITDIAQSNPNVGDPNQVGPTLTKRLLRNTVLAENGRTVVLGGLIGTNVQEIITKTPLLGDIPGLGWLFKRKSTTERKTNLLIFITPRIIKNAEDLAQVTRRSRESMDRFRAVEMRTTLPSGYLETLQHEPLPAPPGEAGEAPPGN